MNSRCTTDIFAFGNLAQRSIKISVWQVDEILLKMFNTYQGRMPKEEKWSMVLASMGRINPLELANEMVLILSTAAEAFNMPIELGTQSKEVGMEIGVTKTKGIQSGGRL